MHTSRQTDTPSPAVRGGGNGSHLHRTPSLRPGEVVQRQQLLQPPHLHTVSWFRPYVGAGQVLYGEEGRQL